MTSTRTAPDRAAAVRFRTDSGAARSVRLFRAKGAFCLLLALFLALLPLHTAHAAPYEEVYADAMSALNGWGVINGYADGQLHPERYVTRAQFVAMVNRAYGYTEVGRHPFSDVPEGAWYEDDIAIAYNAGYFTGTTPNTASPDTNLSRQQAMTLLAKNMRLDAVPGEVTEFADGYAFAPYSRGYVKACVQKGLVNGYPDNTFRPEEPITRGAMAMMLYRALGNLVNNPGTYELGDVFGNVTVSSPNTVLRNTTIAGDLYVSGGLGLGGVTLDNVRTLGNIVVAGSGESETGADSVILRNVESPKLTVDSINGQYLSLRAEGDTAIDAAAVRTSAYLQDRTASGEGLKTISLEGSGNNYTLSGNVEAVTNRSPDSALEIAAGTVQTLNMDEVGAGARVNVENNGTVKTMNLDTGTRITGGGDVENLTVNTAGTSASMLPDHVEIRPGVTANVAGESMDTAKGLEATEDPRLLAGYPRMSDVAPTTATALFSANKTGTVYWAVSNMGDGSIEETELLNPSAFGGKSVASGKSTLTASNTEVKANITALTSGVNYYLSAIMEDARGTRSPLKVISFSTPDGTVPAFTSGTPSVSLNTFDRTTDRSDRYQTQIMAMSNKSCQLFWALYGSGSVAPNAAAFRSGSLIGSLDNGVIDMTQNLPSFLDLTGLSETTTYDAYLMLADADFARTSAVRKVTFTTVDGTSPYFVTPPTVTGVRNNAITFTTVVNEDATIYWVAVKSGTEYPKPPAGQTTVTPDYAILQIASGMNGEKNGSVKAKGNQNTTMTVSGLQPQTAYDIWYIAMDTAGNYSVYPNGDPNNPEDPNNPKKTCMVSANTLDAIAPTVTMEFTRFPENDNKTPYANTDIRLIFSENIQRASTSETLLELYNAVTNASSDADRAVAKEVLADCLRNTVTLYDVTTGGIAAPAPERTTANQASIEKWAVDYRNATVKQEDTTIVVTFPTTRDEDHDSALRLSSGSTYYFQIDDIADTSTARNRMPVTRTDRFKTISAQVALQNLSLAATDYPSGVSAVDMSFIVTPVSTSLADPTACWDMILWSDTSCSYEMYVRSRPASSSPTDPNRYDQPWRRIQNRDGSGGLGTVAIPGGTDGMLVGQSLHFNLYNYGVGSTPLLNDLRDDRIYEYAIRFTQINGNAERGGWSSEVNFRVSILDGSSNNLGNLAANINQERFQASLNAGNITDIGTPNNLQFTMTKAFLDTAAPEFSTGRPIFTPGDTAVEMRLQLTRQGTVYYVIAPADGTITTRDLNGREVTWERRSEVPDSGDSVLLDSRGREVLGEDGSPVLLAPFNLMMPSYLEVVNPVYDNPDIKTGSLAITSGSVPLSVSGLDPETNYFCYFVIRGTGQTYSNYVQLFRFTTTEVQRPIITLDLSNPIVNISANRETNADYMVVNYNSAALSPLLQTPFWNIGDADGSPSGGKNASSVEFFESYLSDTGGNINVLQAMATSLARDDDNGEGSVFDKYATDTFKNRMAEYIRAASSNTAGTIIGVGHNVNVGTDTRVTVDCGTFPMSERTQYAFLCVGRSPLGSGDAFRAIYPLTLMDTEAPVVITIQQTLNMDEEIDAEGVTRILDSCSGVVSLTFNEYLYSTEEFTDPPTLYNVDRGPIVHAARHDDYISIGSLVQSMSTSTVANLVLEENQVNRRTLTVDIRFNRARDGEYVTFASDLCDQYSNVRNTPLSIRVSINRVRQVVRLDEDGEPVYELISIPSVDITSAWDGRNARG